VKHDFLLCSKVDLDLGNYERFLDIKLTRDNNITTGKIYQASWLKCTSPYVHYMLLATRGSEHHKTLPLKLLVLFFFLSGSPLLIRREGEIIWGKLCRFFLPPTNKSIFFFLNYIALSLTYMYRP
jgi:hypothetical protein